MTLTTRAEHAFDREVSYAFEECPANPYAIAESHVTEASGTEAEPASVDVDELAREAAEDAREEMVEQATPYSDGPAVAEAAGERAFQSAWDEVKRLVEDSPVVDAV